jgi:hypothetical protein
MPTTPEQRRIPLGFRDSATGRIMPPPLPRAGVEELAPTSQNYTSTDARMTRGQTGIPDVATDSRERIRANAPLRNAPVQPDLFTPRPEAERMGLGERSQQALDRAKRFTNATGTIVNPPSPGGMPASTVSRAGGIGATALGASETIMNANTVYNRSGGDIGETAKQVAYDIPGAVLGGLGAVAGGSLGRRSPAAMTFGTAAGGAYGYKAGDQIAGGVDRMLGGDGMSPLEAMRQAEQQQSTPQIMSDGGFEVEVPGINDVPGYTEVVYEDDPRHPMYQAPSGAVPQVPSAQIAEPELGASMPEATQASMPEAAQPAGYGQTSVPGIVGRQGADGVPEFTNNPEAIANAQGQFDAGGRLGDGRGTFNVMENAAAMLGPQTGAGAAPQLGQGGAGQGFDMTRQERITQSRIDMNNRMIRSMLSSGKPSDIMQARGLQRQNDSLMDQIENSAGRRERIELGRMQNETNRMSNRDVIAAERAALAAERERYSQAGGNADAYEDAAARNAQAFPGRVLNVFGESDGDGGMSVPPETAQMIELRQSSFAEQRRNAMESMVADLSARAQGGDQQARAELEQVMAQRQQLTAAMFRVGPQGALEPRPVSEWPQEEQDLFFRDVETQLRAQTGKTDSWLPELGGATAGAAAGFRAGRGVRGKIIGAATGAAVGGFGGNTAENAVRGQRSYAPSGSTNQSIMMPSNLNAVFADGDALMVQTQDGQTINFNDMIYQNVNPGRADGIPYMSGRGGVTSEAQPAVRAAFTKALQLAQSGGQGAEGAREALALMAGNNSAAMRNMLSEQQRRELANFIARQ